MIVFTCSAVSVVVAINILSMCLRFLSCGRYDQYRHIAYAVNHRRAHRAAFDNVAIVIVAAVQAVTLVSNIA
jgi:hypothetical protein